MPDRFAIVEQMGHRRVVGRVTEVDECGVRMLRVETLSDPPLVTTIHPQSLYGITDCTEAHAQRAAGRDYSPLRELEAPASAPVGRTLASDFEPDDRTGDEPSDDRDDELSTDCPTCGAAVGEPCSDDCPCKGEG